MRDGEQANEANQANAKRDDDNQPSVTTPVCQVGKEEGQAGTEEVDWNGEELRLSSRIPKLQDDGRRSEAEAINADA